MTYSCKTTQEEVSQTDPGIFAGAFIVNTLYEEPVEGTDLNLRLMTVAQKFQDYQDVIAIVLLLPK